MSVLERVREVESSRSGPMPAALDLREARERLKRALVERVGL